MFNEGKNLREILDEIYMKRTGNAYEPPEEAPAGAAEQNLLLPMETVIENTVREFAPFALVEKDITRLEEFLTFHLQRRTLKTKEGDAAFSNLMLIGREKDSLQRAVKTLAEALSIQESEIETATEATLLGNNGRIPFGSRTRMAVITECQDTPRLNLDGNGSARERSKEAIATYEYTWKSVCDYVKRNPQTVVVVCCQPSVYRSSLRQINDLSRRACATHLHLSELPVSIFLEECLKKFRESTFTVTEEFELALKEYFPDAYRLSDLYGMPFVEDLIRRVLVRYLSRERTEQVLTADCIPDDTPKLQSAEEVLGQMGELVGLQGVKDEFRNMYRMQMAGLAEKGQYNHMIFTGNPGTGKTTVAKMAADLLYSMNIIKKNKLLVVKPADMVSEWQSGTGTKAMEVIRRAYYGILFVDEAYGIATMDKGRELLNILLQEMENNADKLLVIFAGYTDEMRDLLKSNPGLASRIGRKIQFDDYSQEELVEIFCQMAAGAGFSVHPDARDELEDCVASLMTKEFFGNARDVRNMLQDLMEVWSEEYVNALTEGKVQEGDMPKEFLPRHFLKIMPPRKEISINDLVGLDVLKKKLDVFHRQAGYMRHLREKGFTGVGDFSMHMIFTGNPGTGKTTVAKLIADDLYSIGMLKTNRLVVAERKDLVSPYGNTGTKTADMIRKAVGGVLFIDEAYSLADNRRGGFGNECIEVLLTAMEEHKSDTVFIFAGYVEQMQDFLAMNPGIQSRIGYTFHFDDYTTEELTEMYEKKMRKTGFVVTEAALKKVKEVMDYFQAVKNFGNGRFVDHVIHQTISQRACRDFTKNYRSIQVRDIPTIKTLIETAPDSMNLYDPSAINDTHLKRTAIHELGHAIAMVAQDPENVPEQVSIRGQAGSYGRVTRRIAAGNLNEEQLMHMVVELLSGKNAERLIIGTHSTGCVSDYDRAKRITKEMVLRFAMTTYGKKGDEILEAAERRSEELLSAYKEKLETLAQLLLEKGELTGKAFVKALNK